MKRKASTDITETSIKPTHVIDPDGELIIVLQNANSPFAEDIVHENPVIEAAEIVPETVSTHEATPTARKRARKTTKRKEFRIKVSAEKMIAASSFFKRALTGGWKESEAFLRNGSVEVTADGWNLEAFLIILRAIHGKSKGIPPRVTLQKLAKIAVITDYYECKDTISTMADKWISALKKDSCENEPISTACPRDLMLWLWISWYFQHDRKLDYAAKMMVSRGEGLVNPRGLPVPARIIDSINSYRIDLIKGVMFSVDETRESLLSGKKGCCQSCRAIMYGSLAQQIYSSPLLNPWPVAPFPGLSYEGLLRTLRSFAAPSWCYPYARDPSYYHRCARSRFFDLENSVVGLPLGILRLSGFENISRK